MIITTVDALFEYLHEVLCMSQPRVTVPAAWIEADMNLILTQRRTGGCAGLSTASWQAYFTGPGKLSRTKLGRPHADLISRFLAELATRGQRNRISMTETALMMIESLGLADQFHIDARYVLRLRSEFVAQHGGSSCAPRPRRSGCFRRIFQISRKGADGSDCCYPPIVV